MKLELKLKEKLNKKEEEKFYIKHNNTKGITLIALIITIIILLILAVVTINAVQGDGIIGYAKKAKTEWEKASEEEQSKLIDLEIDVAGGPWKQEENTITNIKTKETLTVGDYVNYDPKAETNGATLTYTSPADKTGANNDQTFNVTDYTDKWRVLDVQNGRIRLISEKCINESKKYELKGKNVYINGVDELNKICAIFGHGKGAESACSITVNDINKITGYNPTIQKFGEGLFSEYGNTVTYKINSDGYIATETTNGNKWPDNDEGTSRYNTFSYYDESTRSFVNMNKENSVTITSTYYGYTPTTLENINLDEKNKTVENDASVNNQDVEQSQPTQGVGNEENDSYKYNDIYKMIFGDYSVAKNGDNKYKIKGTGTSYYLASRCVITSWDCARWSLFVVKFGYVGYGATYKSTGYEGQTEGGVRPVVTLKSDVELTKSASNGTIEWNI